MQLLQQVPLLLVQHEQQEQQQRQARIETDRQARQLLQQQWQWQLLQQQLQSSVLGDDHAGESETSSHEVLLPGGESGLWSEVPPPIHSLPSRLCTL